MSYMFITCYAIVTNSSYLAWWKPQVSMSVVPITSLLIFFGEWDYPELSKNLTVLLFSVFAQDDILLPPNEEISECANSLYTNKFSCSWLICRTKAERIHIVLKVLLHVLPERWYPWCISAAVWSQMRAPVACGSFWVVASYLETNTWST